MHPEIERAHNARVPGLQSQAIPDAEGTYIGLPASDSLHASYESQLHVRVAGGQRIVQRSGALLPPPAPGSREPITGWLLSAWNPHGNASTLNENLAFTDALRDTIVELGGLIVATVTTVPPDHSWLEDSIAFRRVSPEVVHQLAVRFGQPTFTAFGFFMVTLIPTGLRDDVHLVTLDYEEEQLPATCPMRTEDLAGQECLIPAGPGTCDAIHSTSIWSAHRSLLVARLGCRECVTPDIGPSEHRLHLADMVMANRYGG
jgi:hypothetical protein